MESQIFRKTLEALRGEVEVRNQRLAAECEAAWAGLAGILYGQSITMKAEDRPTAKLKIESLRALMSGPARRLLIEPVMVFRKTRPQERTLAAIDTHESGLEDLVRLLPPVVELTGEELIAAVGEEAGTALRRLLLRRGGTMELPLRRIAELHFLEEASGRARLEGEFLLALAKGCVAILTPWAHVVGDAFRAVVGGPKSEEAQTRDLVRRQVEVKGLEQQAEQALSKLRAWTSGAGQRMADAIVRGRQQARAGRERRMLLRRQLYFRYWSRQQRAVTALMELDWELTQLAVDLAAAAQQSVDGVDAEHTSLLGELESVIGWLERAQGGLPEQDFPPPAARLLSAEDRTRDWMGAVRAAAMERLPQSVETAEPKRAEPSRRPPWRELQAQEKFLSSLERGGRATALEGFLEAESNHRTIVREIERAREVVSFSLETARNEPEEGEAMMREGLANALSLVVYQKEHARDAHDAVEEKLVAATVDTLVLTHIALEQGRLGLFTQLARQRGARAVRELTVLLLKRTATGGRQTRDAVRSAYHWLLLKVGWETPPIAVETPVVARGYLGDVLDLRLGARDLPMIYKRLFRLAPVEEPRFLVGRDSELAAVAHARSLWKSHRSVSVLVVGARGSGKTSLLNCALSGDLAAETVVRSQFSERITTRPAMREFVRKLLGLGESDDIVSAMRETDRVVVLEELERTFLRRVNGFEGLRELLSIISATSRTTLWILSLNQHSYNHLSAAMRLGEHFTHRINAMAVAPEHMKNAILMRHNLSGLRMHYPLVPESDPRVSQVRRLLGLQQESEDLFFDSLYKQSEGIFRSAFELWQHYMERAEGGVLYMRRPTEPNFGPFLKQVGVEDAFAMRAVLQHGSLTDREFAQVFECSMEASRARLERLWSLECVEPDPAGPGYRIRPEAGRAVHMALHRVNLV